jgi:hypothetical protein
MVREPVISCIKNENMHKTVFITDIEFFYGQVCYQFLAINSFGSHYAGTFITPVF